MKRILFLLIAVLFSASVFSQGNSGDKGKGKQKDKTKTTQSAADKEKIEKEKKEKSEHDKKVWDGTSDNGGSGPKPSKNQPAKVREAFQRDYPNASNVSWSKYRGDWTASFRNGVWMSTAVYHANGDRRDTRTPVTRNEMPRIVLDSIFKKTPGTRLEDVIKIEVPKTVKDIFRIKDIIQGKPEYLYYNSDGLPVKYDY
jgi:uncharacterized protein YxeA